MVRSKKTKQNQQSGQNSQQQDSQKQVQVNTDNSPKLIPVSKLPQKLKCKKIVLNVSDTQYPIVQQIGEQLGWIIQQQQGIGDWDVWWTDREIQPNTLYRMNLHQKINHFPGIYVLARKNLLGLHLMAMKNKFKQEYDFFPETWIVPMQFSQFRQFYQSIDQGKVRTYIVKPQALSQGRGIFLTRDINDILNGNKYVIQRYLKNPLLLDGLKFDLRIYVLLAGSQPLRLYIYEQGLARLATKPYQQPTAQNLHQNYIHLTNYSLNKTNPSYVYNKSQKQMDVGHKRSLKGVYEKLAKSGIDMGKLKSQIEDIIIKTVISGLPSIRHQYKYCQPEQYQGNMCFHILGFDVMIMDDLKPVIIEVNHTPSFQTGTPLDYQIKKNLIKDTFKLMRITQKQKKTGFLKSKQLTKKRIQTGKRDIFKGQQRKQQLDKAQSIRQEEQRQILQNLDKPNGYKQIYPFKDQKKNFLYQQFYQGAQQVMKQQKDNRKKIISDQKVIVNSKKQMTSNKKVKTKNQSAKQISNERTNSRRQTVNLERKILQKKTSIEEQNMQKSSSKQSKNQLKIMEGQDHVIEQAQIKVSASIIDDNVSSRNSSGLYNQSDKKIIYGGSQNSTNINSHKVANFQIRSNHKVIRNGPLTDKPDNPSFCPTSNVATLQDGDAKVYQSNHNVNKYQELMNKFVKSKDLDAQQNSNSNHKNNQKQQKQEILRARQKSIAEESGSKTIKSLNQQNLIKQNGSIGYLMQIKQQTHHQRQKFYQKVLPNNQSKSKAIQQLSFKDKFSDIHLLSINPPKLNRNTPSTNQNRIRSQHFTQEQLFTKTVSPPLNLTKQIRNSKVQNKMQNKIGKFIKPKTFDLHESKFPDQQRFIVRQNGNNFGINMQHYQTPTTHTMHHLNYVNYHQQNNQSNYQSNYQPNYQSNQQQPNFQSNQPNHQTNHQPSHQTNHQQKTGHKDTVAKNNNAEHFSWATNHKIISLKRNNTREAEHKPKTLDKHKIRFYD